MKFNYRMPASVDHVTNGDWDENAQFDFTNLGRNDFSVLPDLDLANNLQICPVCQQYYCICWTTQYTYVDQPVWQAHPVTIPAAYGNRNEASPPQLQEMESNGEADALTTPATISPEVPYTNPFGPIGMTTIPQDADPSNIGMVDQDQSLFETPEHTRYTDHFQASNIRESVEAPFYVSAPDSEIRGAANILANATANIHNGNQMSAFDYLTRAETMDQMNENSALVEHMQNNLLAHSDLPIAGLSNSSFTSDIDPQNGKGFAKLMFPDGDFIVTTHDVVLGRNMEVWKQWKRHQHNARKARETLYSYRQEPSQHSQPSQPSDGDQHGRPSASSRSLEGRPAPPSNMSEHGGMVSYQAHSDGELEAQRAVNRKRRSLQFSKSSSTTSVAPASLHPSMMEDYAPNSEPEARTYTFIKLHTQVPDDITKISKEHLRFSFNFDEARWELYVIGNRAFVNGSIFDQGNIIPLDHNDEIMIATVHITFKLPDNYRYSPGLSRGTFSNSGEEEDLESLDGIDTSPVRRLSDAMEAGELDEANDNSKNRKKLKLHVKPSSKAQKAGPDPSPEAVKKSEKATKPKVATKGPGEASKEENISPPSTMAMIEPGSALAEIPPEQLPQKRKGPGRPPKNGILSRRDETLVKRKRQQLEKNGLPVPNYDWLVQIVRAESKNKEQQAKALRAGQPVTADTVVTSIEFGSGSGLSTSNPAPLKGAVPRSSAMPTEPVPKTSPKTKRTAKSPSPIKPMAEFTEEELKKPSLTYVHILDEILRDHPTGQADLPEIYDRIMKRYPYYKYIVATTGWQSSVRHNLLQHERFQETGKSGKGKLWTINYDVALEKEKKRKNTPPKVPVQNGQYIPAPQYGNPYAQPHANGHPQFNNGAQPGPSTYYSPYAHPGQHTHHGAHAQPTANNAQGFQTVQSLQQPQQSNVQQPNDRSLQPQPPVVSYYHQPLVEQIMAYRLRYLAPYTGDEPAMQVHQNRFQQITNVWSDMHQQGRLSASPPPLETEEEKKMFFEIGALFRKWNQVERANKARRAKQQTDGLVQQTTHQAVEDVNAINVSMAEAQTMPVTTSAASDAFVSTWAPMNPALTATSNDTVAATLASMNSALTATASTTTGGYEVTQDPFLYTNQEGPTMSPPINFNAGSKRPADNDEDGPNTKRARGE